MQPRKWMVGFTGTAADGQQKRFQVDLQKYMTAVVMPALQDPVRPQCCPLCFDQYADMITDRANEPFFTELLVTGHDFLDACAALLAVSRTSDDLDLLRGHLKDNIRRCGTQRWHPYLTQYSTDLLYPFISGVYFCLSAPFYRGPRPLKPGATFAKPRKGIWPTSLADLLPRGPQASIAAHVDWCQTYITPSSVAFVSMVLDIARPTIWPLVLAEPQRGMLLKSVLFLMLFGCDTLVAARGEVQGIRSEWSPGERSGAMTIATQMLCTVRDGHDSRDGDAALFYAGWEQRIYDSINQVFFAGVALSERNRGILAYLALRLQDELSLPAYTLHPAIADVRDGVYLREIQEPNLPSGTRMAHHLICTRSRLRACGGPECAIAAATMQAGDLVKLQACARCRFTRYCGRGCQQADWKDAEDRAPHKALCPILNKLSAAEMASSTLQEFTPVFERASLTKEEFAVLVLWARTSSLVPKCLFERFI